MRLRLLSLLVLLPILAGSSRAEAQFQAFPAANVEVYIGRVKRMPSDPLYINQRQCEGSSGLGTDSAEIRVQITNLGLTAPSANVLAFWLGSGSQDCHAAAGRTPDAFGSTPCVRLAPSLDSISTKRQNLYFVAHDLFASPDSNGACDRESEQTLYVVPLVNETPTRPGSKPDGGVGAPIPIRFEVDVVPPAPASAFTGGSGQVSAELTWVGVLPDALHKFEVYFDTTAIRLANPGPCESELLRTGEPLPVLLDAELTGLPSRTAQENRLLVDLAALGLLPGEKLPATVVVRDPAGNQSGAAEVVCVERQFSQAQASGANASDDACFNGCAVSRPGDSTGTHWLWACPALWLAGRVQVRLRRFRRRRLRKSS